MITKLSKNNSNKSNNKYCNLESIFEKSILWIYTCQKPSDTQKKSKHLFSVFRIVRFRISSECFRDFLDWIRRLDPILFNSVVAYKRDFFRNMASENSREALGVRNAFSEVDIGRIRGFKPKKWFWNLIPACAIINRVSLRT